MNTAEFILKFREEDVRKLALQGKKYPEVDMEFALNQIAGWQTARKKLPSWAAIDGIIYPPHLNMEQCSSETTSLYKQQLITHHSEPITHHSEPITPHSTMVDLTGGFGVDFSFLCRGFERAVYVEKNPQLCEIARKNFALLGLDNAEVVCGDSVEYLNRMKPVDFIYVDPARRDSNGSRTYAMQDCTPNVVELQELLLEKADSVMVKLSPMLDWHKAVEDLKNTTEVHIVSVQNECKELLVVMNKIKDRNAKIKVYCINGEQHFQTYQNSSLDKRHLEGLPKEGQTLLVPNSSIMKAGLFAELCQQYNIRQIAPNSHLFISELPVPDFPGRQFMIQGVYTMNKKDLKVLFSKVSSANIATRNFPLTPHELQKRLKIKDGGKDFIFATTDIVNNHILLLCSIL